jgi:hypothetical protein
MQGADLVRLAGRDRMAVLLDALASAMLGREQIERGFSLRDAVRSLGLQLEGDLRKALERPGSNPVPSQAGLKAHLMKVIEEFQVKLQSAEIQPADAKAIRDFTPALERAVRAIESQQVLNVHFQQTEGKLLIQVPLILPGLTGKADIFIRDEEWRPGNGERKEAFRVVFALEMDALGDVMAQAHFRANEATVRITCEREPVASFISGLLPELEKHLMEAGYHVAKLVASADSNVREAIQECIREELYGDGQTLSVFA